MIDIDRLRQLAQAINEHSDDRAEILAEFYAATQSDIIIELLDRLEASEKSDAESLTLYRKARDERDALRAKIVEIERQEPVATVIKEGDSRYWMSERLWTFPDGKYPLYALPGAQAQPAQKAVAYLDLGVGGYMDIGTDLTDKELDAIPKGRHMLGIVGTYGVDGYVPAQPAPSISEGWLRAIDEALVVAHIGVANKSDTYEQAKAKLDNLIGLHVDVATDPAVNGGWKLVPIEPTETFYQCFSAYDGASYSNPFDYDDFVKDWREALAAAPEAKP